jgi:hypothetical protein
LVAAPQAEGRPGREIHPGLGMRRSDRRSGRSPALPYPPSKRDHCPTGVGIAATGNMKMDDWIALGGTAAAA